MASEIVWYEVETKFEYEYTIVEELGRVEGHDSGRTIESVDWRKDSETLRIQAPDENYAKVWVYQHYDNPKIRNVEIVSIDKKIVSLHAIINVHNCR